MLAALAGIVAGLALHRATWRRPPYRDVIKSIRYLYCVTESADVREGCRMQLQDHYHLALPDCTKVLAEWVNPQEQP